MDLVSVLLPVYRETKVDLKLAIESILSQNYRNLELIIICDNPHYGHLALLKHYCDRDDRVKLHINSQNYGIGASLNIGISLAKGDYIARMDADDISFADRLSKQLDYLRKSNLDLIGGAAVLINESGSELGCFNKPTSKSSVEEYIRYASPCLHPTWFGKIEIFREIGYEEVSPGQDYIFLSEVFQAGYKLGNMKDKILYYRVSANSLSKSRPEDTLYISSLVRHAIRDKSKVNIKAFKKFQGRSNAALRYLVRIRESLIYRNKNKNVLRKCFSYILVLGLSLLHPLLLDDLFVNMKLRSLK